jgi:tetratricopeptide (TPR) repeat protein
MRWSAIAIAVAVAAYASAAANGFIWDDHHVIERGRAIASLRGVPSLFAHDTMWSSDAGAFAAKATVDTYRPLTMTTFALERAAAGLRPLVYHYTNVFLHIACVLLLARVGRRLGLSAAAAAFGAMLFAAHPALAEGVHYVNGRSDPLCLAFFLLAVDAWLRGRGVLAAAAMLCATLCKETAFLLAPAALVLAPYRGGALFWPWAVGGGAGLALRLHALGRPAASAGGRHLAYALARLPRLWLDGLRALVVPQADAAPSLHERYRAIGVGWTIFAVVSILALIAACAWPRRAPHAPWKRRAFAGWALATFLCALAPVALLTYDEGWFGWGRYLYPAAAPALLWAGGAIVDGALPRLRPRARRAAVAACALVVALSAAQTFAAGRDYRDDRAFAAALVADHPDQSHGYYELGVVELRDGHAAAALDAAERAVAIAPGVARYWSLLANARMSAGRAPDAFAAARRALALDPADVNARYLAAIEALGAHRDADAAALLLDAIAAEPTQEGPWKTLAQAVQHLGPDSTFAAEIRARLADPRYAAIAPRVTALLH